MPRKRRTAPPPRERQILPPSEGQLLGKKYAEVIRERIQALRTDLMLTQKVRHQIADDLEALAQIAETQPECFRGLK